MTKTAAFFFICFFLVSCGNTAGEASQMAMVTEAEIQNEFAPTSALTFDVNAQLSGFTRDQEDKIYKAIDLIKRVVGTPKFKTRVLNYTWKGKKQFHQNKGRSNAQVYRSILEASEILTPGKNNTMDIKLRAYYENSVVIGYTMPSTGTIYLNTKFLNSAGFRENKVAMNLTHEWLHKLGYKHSVENNDSRPHTVPYAIGYIMRDLAGQLE